MADYLCARALDEALPAYVQVDREGRVLSVGGEIARYGLDGIGVGSEICERLEVVAGYDFGESDPVCFRTIEVASHVYADVHVLGADHGSWIVVVDRSSWAAERRVAQQLANDMSLLRDELGRRNDTLEAPDTVSPSVWPDVVRFASVLDRRPWRTR